MRERPATIKKTITLDLALAADCERLFAGALQPLNWHQFCVGVIREKVEREKELIEAKKRKEASP